jgi:membrane-bound ClpP family serine protease
MLILAIESGVLLIVAAWLLASVGRLYEPSAWLVALGLIAAGDIVSALVMERIAPTRVLLAPGEAGHDSGTVVRGFGNEALGVIRIRGEFWRARSLAPEKLGAGDRVQIVQRQGLVLEVEPLDHGSS